MPIVYCQLFSGEKLLTDQLLVSIDREVGPNEKDSRGGTFRVPADQLKMIRADQAMRLEFPEKSCPKIENHRRELSAHHRPPDSRPHRALRRGVRVRGVNGSAFLAVCVRSWRTVGWISGEKSDCRQLPLEASPPHSPIRWTWSRRLSAAEMAGGARHLDQRRRASMGPPPFSGGKGHFLSGLERLRRMGLQACQLRPVTGVRVRPCRRFRQHSQPRFAEPAPPVRQATANWPRRQPRIADR